jgi:hypothetical protein
VTAASAAAVLLEAGAAMQHVEAVIVAAGLVAAEVAPDAGGDPRPRLERALAMLKVSAASWWQWLCNVLMMQRRSSNAHVLP